MNRWLLKEEPSQYSFADLVRDGETEWGGISNALALQYLRQCVAGDLAFFYHTGKEKQIVGIMEIIEPKSPQPASIKQVTIRVRPGALLAHPVTLAQVKGDRLLNGWILAKNPRLSVMPVAKAQWQRVLELSDKPK